MCNLVVVCGFFLRGWGGGCSGVLINSILMVCVFVQYKFAVIVMGRQEYITEEDKPISMNQFMPQHLHGQCMGLHSLFGFVFGS